MCSAWNRASTDSVLLSLLQFLSLSFPIGEVGMVLLTLLEYKEDALEKLIVVIVIISMSTFIEHFLWAWHCSKSFLWIGLLNLHNNPIVLIIILMWSLFYRWENQVEWLAQGHTMRKQQSQDLNVVVSAVRGLPRWLSGKESACQSRRCKRCGFNPWVEQIPGRRKWRPIPVFLPGKSHGQRSLTGYNLWGPKELDMTEHTHTLTHTLAVIASLIPCARTLCLVFTQFITYLVYHLSR